MVNGFNGADGRKAGLHGGVFGGNPGSVGRCGPKTNLVESAFERSFPISGIVAENENLAVVGGSRSDALVGHFAYAVDIHGRGGAVVDDGQMVPRAIGNVGENRTRLRIAIGSSMVQILLAVVAKRHFPSVAVAVVALATENAVVSRHLPLRIPQPAGNGKRSTDAERIVIRYGNAGPVLALTAPGRNAVAPADFSIGYAPDRSLARAVQTVCRGIGKTVAGFLQVPYAGIRSAGPYASIRLAVRIFARATSPIQENGRVGGQLRHPNPNKGFSSFIPNVDFRGEKRPVR